jgi:hypothetical protein
MHEVATTTEALSPNLDSVPYIVINKKYTEASQDAAQLDLFQFVCSLDAGKKTAGCKKGGKNKKKSLKKNRAKNAKNKKRTYRDSKKSPKGKQKE